MQGFLGWSGGESCSYSAPEQKRALPTPPHTSVPHPCSDQPGGGHKPSSKDLASLSPLSSLLHPCLSECPFHCGRITQGSSGLIGSMDPQSPTTALYAPQLPTPLLEVPASLQAQGLICEYVQEPGVCAEPFWRCRILSRTLTEKTAQGSNHQRLRRGTSLHCSFPKACTPNLLVSRRNFMFA